MSFVDLRGNKTGRASEVWQWDFGQKLQIKGANLDDVVEVQYSRLKTDGKTTSREGRTKDGITEAPIPNEFLQNEAERHDYEIYAFIYITDEESGRTDIRIAIPVRARPKPGDFGADIPVENPFGEAIAETRKSEEAAAGSASAAAQSAEESSASATEAAASAGAAAGSERAAAESAAAAAGSAEEAGNSATEAGRSELAAAQSAEESSASAAAASAAAKSVEDSVQLIETNEKDIADLKGDLSNKVGYAEISGTTITLYADDTKKNVINSIEIPSSDDKNTTYSFGISGNTITITPSDGDPETIDLPSVTDEHIIGLINEKLGVIENGAY